MALQITPHLPITGFIFLLTASLGAYGALQYHRRGHQSELLAFISLMFSLSLWQFTDMFIFVVKSVELKLLGYNISNTIVVWLFAYSVLWFALAYSNNDQWVNRWTVSIPVATVVAASTAAVLAPEYLYEVEGLVTQSSVTILGITIEQWVILNRKLKLPFYIFQLYGYVVILIAGGVLGRYLVRNRGDLYTGQAVALAIGIGTPLVVNVLLFAGLIPPELNPTSTSFGVTGVAFAIAIFRYRLLRVAPVGRQQLVDTMDDPVVMLDGEARVVDTNPAARELFDAPTGWQGMGAKEFFNPFPEQYEQFEGERSIETEIHVTVDGTTRYFDLAMSPIEDESNTSTGQLIVLREITEQKEREQRLETRERQLELMSQVQSRVLRHNIRNDLQVVKGNSEMLAREVDSEYAPMAERAVDKAEDLMSISSKARTVETLIEREQTPIELDLSILLREMVDSYHTEFPEVSFTLTCPDACRVEVAPSLKIAIENIVENAAEHNEGDARTVEVTVTGDDEGVVITVADDGPGIPTQELTVLEQEDETSLEHGSGMGLWVVHWAVDMTNAEIEYDTDYTGTEVRFRIPR